jgi:mRNA guanylyltransferase
MEFVSFCNHSTWQITDPADKKLILNNLYEKYPSQYKNQFPGPLPVSLERSKIDYLQNNQYWVCAKIDGTRYLFVCSVIKEKYYCYLINRNNDIFLLSLEMSKDAFDGTILDGELTYNKITNKYEFVVHDAIYTCGTSCKDEPHSSRMLHANYIISFITYNPNYFISVHKKHFSKLADFRYYICNIQTMLDHTTDGYIFTPEIDPIKSGTHQTLFKWKPLEKNTVDFHVEANKQKKGAHILKVSKNQRLLNLNNHFLLFHKKTDIYTKLMMMDPYDSFIIECEYKGNNNWNPILIRSDKSHPNSLFTFNKTLLNIQENIKLDELVNYKLN